MRAITAMLRKAYPEIEPIHADLYDALRRTLSRQVPTHLEEQIDIAVRAHMRYLASATLARGVATGLLSVPEGRSSRYASFYMQG